MPAQLSAAAQSSAVSAVAAVSGAAANISTNTATLLVSSLSSVAAAATAATSAAAAAGGRAAAAAPPNPALLTQVLNLVATVADGQSAQLNSTTAPPVTISTPSIQVYVALDAPGPGSRLFSAPISAPGSAAAFDPLPAGALGAATGPVRTNFISLAFVRSPGARSPPHALAR